MNKELLSAAGVDCDDALHRINGNVELFNTLLLVFADDRSIADAADALSRGDYEAMFESVHALKGISGNLGMKELFASSSEVISMLRAKEYDNLTTAFQKMTDDYNRVISAIRDGAAG